MNYHDGSIYCIDWSDSERLIATGSNDKHVKLLVNPIFQESESSNILALTLKGHKAKVRTVCFHPLNENILLSGGNVDSQIMVWDAETGDRVNTLAGHEGGTLAIQPSHYGTLFASIGEDK
jgi:WD40 repeat protein